MSAAKSEFVIGVFKGAVFTPFPKQMWRLYRSSDGRHGAKAYVVNAPNARFYAPESVIEASEARFRLLPGLYDFRAENPSCLEMDLIISGSGDLDILVEIAGTNAVVRHRLFTCEEIMNGGYVKGLHARLEKIGPHVVVS